MMCCIINSLLICFLIDNYIIFFANMPIVNKLAVFCQRCVGVATGTTYSNYQLADNETINPNPLCNEMRDYLGLPKAVDYDQIKQYREMKKFLPNVPETEYTYSTSGVENQLLCRLLSSLKLLVKTKIFFGTIVIQMS